MINFVIQLHRKLQLFLKSIINFVPINGPTPGSFGIIILLDKNNTNIPNSFLTCIPFASLE